MSSCGQAYLGDGVVSLLDHLSKASHTNFLVSQYVWKLGSYYPVGFPGASVVRNPPAMRETQETQVRSLGWENPLEKEMATHFSILAWKIPWTMEPGRLLFMGSQRVGHNWATSLSLQSHTKLYLLLPQTLVLMAQFKFLYYVFIVAIAIFNTFVL